MKYNGVSKNPCDMSNVYKRYSLNAEVTFVWTFAIHLLSNKLYMSSLYVACTYKQNVCLIVAFYYFS